MNILFICTHNRCRSILAEAIANHAGKGLITAASAGSSPAGEIHPMTREILDEYGIPSENLYSKSWNDLDGFVPDVVITVCDRAAEEPCPLWIGNTAKVHWGLADPSILKGNHDEKLAAFRETLTILETRINQLTHLLANDPELEEKFTIQEILGVE